MNNPITIFPAIDLRQGQVVRLKEGDPLRQTQYSQFPADMARQWLEAGSEWLHVVNLDGAFGESGAANLAALRQIVAEAGQFHALVQFGGGLRNLQAIETAFAYGVSRVVLGTVVIENPDFLQDALKKWGSEKIAVSLDARDGLVQSHGWHQTTQLKALDLAVQFKQMGLSWLVFTDIARDGLQTGFNLDATVQIARSSQLNVIASGGVRGEQDILLAQKSALPGIIIGRALYEGSIDLKKLIMKVKG